MHFLFVRSENGKTLVQTFLGPDYIFHAFFQNLPKTAYYKFIDYWLMFSMQMLVITMGIHTYVAHCCFMANNQKFSIFSNPKPKTGFVAGKKNKITAVAGPFLADSDPLAHAKWVNNAGKLALLFVVMIFNAIFWTLALNEYLLPPEVYLERNV